MQKLVWVPITSTLIGIGLIATALQGEATHVTSLPGTGDLSYEVSDFDKISAYGPAHVLVTVGPAFSVRADGSNEALDRYEVTVEHGSLEIRPKRHNFWNSSWKQLRPATFHVALPELSATSVAGSGDMKVDRVEGDEFSVSVAGSGAFDVASLTVDEANFSVTGSGDLTAHGHVTKSNVSIAGSGDVHLRELSSDDANVSIVGSGDAALTVSKDARVSTVGSGNVDIAGTTNCKVSRFGGGHVTCNGRLEDGRDNLNWHGLPPDQTQISSKTGY